MEFTPPQSLSGRWDPGFRVGGQLLCTGKGEELGFDIIQRESWGKRQKGTLVAKVTGLYGRSSMSG